MSEPKTAMSNDGLYTVSREHYKDSVDFYINNKITVEDKKEKEEDVVHKQKEDSVDIDGLEELILGFTAPHTQFHYDEDVAGQEDIKDRAKMFAQRLWEFIVEISRWIGEMFTNKLARVEIKVKYTVQRRKINGIKSTPVKFYPSMRSLIVPSTITSNPVWVAGSANKALDFYNSIIDTHKYLKTTIRNAPKTKDAFARQQKTILEAIGRGIAKNTANDGVYQTDILPGCKIYNIQLSASDSSDEVLTYFTDSSVRGRFVATEWTPTQALIDENIKLLELLINTVRKEQRTTTTLLKGFANEIKTASNRDGINSVEKNYFIWLTNLHKRLANSTLNYVITVIEALNTFVYSGIK